MTDESKKDGEVLAIDAEIEAVYRQMKQDYASTMPNKISQLEQTVREAQSHPADKRRLQKALGEVHRVKGTIGSYGFPEIAELLGSLERLLQKENAASPANPNFWHKIDRRLEQIFTRAKARAKYFSDTAGDG